MSGGEGGGGEVVVEHWTDVSVVFTNGEDADFFWLFDASKNSCT